MQFDVDLGSDSLTRLRRDGADAQLSMCFAPEGAAADDAQICFDAFVGVIWPVLLDGLPDLETGTPIVYELEPGVFRVVPANDRIRIELRRDSDSPDRSLVTDLQPFARVVLTEAAAFHRYCQREDIRVGTAWITDLADRLDGARRWYTARYDVPVDNIGDG